MSKRRILLHSIVFVGAAVLASAGVATTTAVARSDGAGEGKMIMAQQRPKPAPGPAPSSPPPAPAAAAPAVPQRTERIVQDAWTITCAQMKSADTKKVCSAILQVAEKENRRVVFSWVLGRTPQGVLTSVFQTPTGVQLQKGVDIKFGDAAAPRKANYVICTNQGCEASVTMDDAMVKEAMAGVNGNAVATITLADGRGVNFTMPIKGIDKAFAAIGR